MKKLIFGIIIISLMVVPGMVLAHEDHSCKCDEHHSCCPEGFTCGIIVPGHWIIHEHHHQEWVSDQYGCIQNIPVPSPVITGISSFYVPFRNDYTSCNDMMEKPVDMVLNGEDSYKSILIAPIGMVDRFQSCQYNEIDAMYDKECMNRIYYKNNIIENNVASNGYPTLNIVNPTQKFTIQGVMAYNSVSPIFSAFVVIDTTTNEVVDGGYFVDSFSRVYGLTDDLRSCRIS